MIATGGSDKDRKDEGDTIQEKRRKHRQKGITKKEFEDTLVKVFTHPVSDKPLEDDPS